MSAPVALAYSPEFMGRARRLAGVLDEQFDGFGALVEESAVDAAVAILEAIEAKGCRIVFADEDLPGAEALQ